MKKRSGALSGRCGQRSEKIDGIGRKEKRAGEGGEGRRDEKSGKAEDVRKRKIQER